MGEQNVKRIQKSTEKAEYIAQLMDDIDALEQLLATNAFEGFPMHIGAEQEFCLVDNNWAPSARATELLNKVNDGHFTHEIALYNLEINLDPIPLKKDCFTRMHQQLNALLDKATEAGKAMETKIVLTGILPTLEPKHIDLSFMTPIPRYRALNEAVKEVRKDDIEMHIRGVDELNLHHDSVLYEGCNTSFQAHLQIDPEDFRDSYNWAQAIAGPVLSVCANSPLLMGRELWEETRIALFAQSVDTRASTFYLDEREPRVGFGNSWASGTAAEFYKESIVRFRSLLTADFESRSTEELKRGKVPKLKALGLHNGTVYKWNRLCYGQSNGKPHLRIENRYLPAGPSTTDEIANMMMWVGIMLGRPPAFNAIHSKMDFRDAKSNFFNAARYGMAAQFYWNGKLISSRDLLLDHLLPMAYRGLSRMKIDPADVEKYLTVIENRVRAGIGSRWLVHGYRRLLQDHNRPDALRILTAALHHRQLKGYTVDAWRLPDREEVDLLESHKKVGDTMNTRIITAQEDDSAELVLKIMQWENIHHVPILDGALELTGLLSWEDIHHLPGKKDEMKVSVSQIMSKNLITISQEALLAEAKKTMELHKVRCLPVVEGKKLLGILTSNDL